MTTTLVGYPELCPRCRSQETTLVSFACNDCLTVSEILRVMQRDSGR